MKNVPCDCIAALSVGCVKLVTISSFSVSNSCCSGEALVWFNRARVKFRRSSNFTMNKGTCISSMNGLITIADYTVFSDNVAEKFSGSTLLLANSTLHTTLGRYIFFFATETDISTQYRKTMWWNYG